MTATLELEKVLEDKTIGYGERESKIFAIKFLGNFLERPLIKWSGLTDIIQKAAQQAYWTTFTDDSGYIENGLGLMSLKEQWEKYPDKRRAIVSCLNYFYSGNWIMQANVKEIAKEIGLEKEYR
jgi:hypothetical protein